MDEEREVNDFCKDSEMRLRPTQLAQESRRRAGGGPGGEQEEGS